jgi:hypothetical protein
METQICFREEDGEELSNKKIRDSKQMKFLK